MPAEAIIGCRKTILMRACDAQANKGKTYLNQIHCSPTIKGVRFKQQLQIIIQLVAI